ncbi:chorismate--pyruvate lyase family protein [Agarivorans sp. MS3-6]|uniref:chorismate--pyruvate lyase family protein n=1 Tax=Agarivorans sp. TSD2052 TaxID=2937286 RepID=UPI00200F7AE4|nr:chorismate lyase [Agarivorans sp. TSD2052]UPW18221.1 chorismate lyase [Agarivorans sp. TSD2052]
MNLNKNPPCGAEGVWHLPQKVELSSHVLADWLLYPGSLTARLREHCQHFSINVLFEGYQEIAEHERMSLACAGPYWIREVLLLCDGKAWVFARSIIPQSSLEGDAAAVSQLNNKPLGELLFTEKGQRQSLEIGLIDKASSIYQYANDNVALWGRRSRFILDSAPLLVAEVFLPDSLAYSKE